MKINPDDMDRPLRKIIEHLQDLTHHAKHNAGLTLAQQQRIFKAGQEIADVVYEKHTDQPYGHPR